MLTKTELLLAVTKYCEQYPETSLESIIKDVSNVYHEVQAKTINPYDPEELTGLDLDRADSYESDISKNALDGTNNDDTL
ncbi:hypothetical protein [Ligilactobacillus salivarius]|uniref:hypothetical protein n=1 Tax=Ligilactobacillus salivarius TaxID=1624 RepID=UPI0023682446|nr:hypothetical protein [Ligilactobacillus salivarius]